jgi:hypothetical protein
MKRVFLVILVILIVIAGSIWALYIFTMPPTSEQAIDDYVAGVIQSMSVDKTLNYTIVSREKVNSATMSGEIWCSIINPSMQTSELALVSHFVVMIYGNDWSGLLFDDTEIQKERWSKIGCSHW